MRTELSLNGAWELAPATERTKSWDEIKEPYPIAAVVPGEVHPALMAAGLIPDPYYGLNSDEVAWVEEKDWWYRRSFRLPQDFIQSQVFLEFDGLDTFGRIYLNGEHLASVSEMFIPHRYDVTSKLKASEENTLEARFLSAKRITSRLDLQGYYVRYNPLRLGARKMQASFGWDWLPRLLGAGIWREVRLTSCAKLSIGDLHVKPQLVDGAGQVHFKVTLQNHIAQPVEVFLRLSVSRGELQESFVVQGTVSSGGEVVEAVIPVAQLELWWPNGFGEQPMYDATVELRSGAELLDRREQRFAFRTIELRERNEAGQPAFIIAINGALIYIKGANWIPPDGFPSRVTPEKYRELLTLARDAHLNMLRIWGGGVYEAEAFYDLCDELGIMIWQDFMFALAEYPDNTPMAAMVEREAQQVVCRLRHHPALVVWCGNSECEMDNKITDSWSGKRFFHQIIPSIIDAFDGSRPYWPSSPYGGPVAHSGEYGTYHGEPWFHTAQDGVDSWQAWIEKDKGLFMAEFPTQGPPEVETLRRFAPPEQLFPIEGLMWERHALNNVQRQERINLTSLEALHTMIRSIIGEPHNIEEFALLGGVLQGEFLKSQIDYYRRHKFAIAGCMFWMFDDAWPAVGYSVVDWYMRPKPAYYFIKRAYAPVALVFGKVEGQAVAWVVNDRLEEVTVEVSLGLIDLDAKTAPLEQLSVTVPANTVQQVWRCPPPSAPTKQVLVGQLKVNGEIVSRTNYYFALLKDMDFPAPQLEVEREQQDNSLHLQISSASYLPAVAVLGLPDLARPGDNYFFLLPGDNKEIILYNTNASQVRQINIETPFI